MSRLTVSLVIALSFVSVSLSARNVVEHDGVGLSYEEVEQLVSRWQPDMQKAAANDEGDRLELLNNALIAKKLDMKARNVKPDEDPDLYWEIVLKTRRMYRDMMMEEFRENLEMPDFEDLAKELYQVEKARFAYVPEHRLSSHILVACNRKSCTDELKAKAETVVQKMQAGESFSELAQEYSDDPGSKDKGGRFDRWMPANETGVAEEYVEALFALESPGDVSGVVYSKFGYHVIRFDEMRDPYFLEYEEVAPKIKKHLEREYLRDAVAAYVRAFNMDDSSMIDGEAMENIFSKYKAPSGSR